MGSDPTVALDPPLDRIQLSRSVRATWSPPNHPPMRDGALSSVLEWRAADHPALTITSNGKNAADHLRFFDVL